MNAQNIATFKFSIIIENLQVYKDFNTQLEEFKKKKFDQLKNEETLLINIKKEIEESKILLSEIEYKSRISKFEEKRNNFQKKVNKLNNYLNENIEINEEKILKEIVNIVKIIATENNIDIIFADDQYFLSTDNIDISGQIYNKLNNLNIILELNKYE